MAPAAESCRLGWAGMTPDQLYWVLLGEGTAGLLAEKERRCPAPPSHVLT